MAVHSQPPEDSCATCRPRMLSISSDCRDAKAPVSMPPSLPPRLPFPREPSTPPTSIIFASFLAIRSPSSARSPRSGPSGPARRPQSCPRSSADQLHHLDPRRRKREPGRPLSQLRFCRRRRWKNHRRQRKGHAIRRTLPRMERPTSNHNCEPFGYPDTRLPLFRPRNPTHHLPLNPYYSYRNRGRPPLTHTPWRSGIGGADSPTIPTPSPSAPRPVTLHRSTNRPLF